MTILNVSYMFISSSHDVTVSDVDDVLGLESKEKQLDEMDDEDLKKYLKKMPALRKRLGALEQEEEQEEQDVDEDVDVNAWGQRRGMYYQDDEDELEDEEAAEEQEEEVLRLQKERAAAMKEDDFLEDFQDALGASAARAEGGSGLAKPQSGDKATVHELNDELDQIDLRLVLYVYRPFYHLIRW